MLSLSILRTARVLNILVVTEAVEMNGITSKEAESDFDKQADEAPAEEFTRKGQDSEAQHNTVCVCWTLLLFFDQFYAFEFILCD